MSAKSCTFAAEIVKNMKIEQMTHTPWRCQHSRYITRNGGLWCLYEHEGCDKKTCKACAKWKPSELAISYFDGSLRDIRQRRVLTEIYLERMKKGRF